MTATHFLVEDIVKRALLEDIGLFDATTTLTVPPSKLGRALVKARSPMVLSGTEPFLAVFGLVDKAVVCRLAATDGEELSANDTIFELSGPAASILTSERVALNFLGHLSGVATLTKRFVNALSQFKTKILDTRKTLPGLRLLEKKAVRHGGGFNHRFSLHDGILIKDNHIQAAGSITEAVSRVRANGSNYRKIEVEVDDMAQLTEALEVEADMILLDNMTINELKTAVNMVKKHFEPGPVKTLLEASGGINLNNVAQVAETGVDYISVGALTHSAPWADVGLDWI
ncbi:MAG: carboxylating nicotinate-nucleotide diphosphorylase [Deltaproteobacteria bacterium]|jgi:nicotinate-nucleotide pyrophosphorylase (carboxylating)|nr:carboxylating nicotinate-nucleotide diphosphorylase [Deltaproteobacteria bacterium]